MFEQKPWIGLLFTVYSLQFTVSCAPWVLRRASSESRLPFLALRGCSGGQCSESSLPFSWRIGLGNKNQEKPAASVKPKNDYEAFFLYSDLLKRGVKVKNKVSIFGQIG